MNTQDAIIKWLKKAGELGFDSEYDMWKTLQPTMTRNCMAKLLGVTPKTISNRMRKFGLVTIKPKRYHRSGGSGPQVQRKRIFKLDLPRKKLSRCITCGKKLSLYNHTNTCWACQGTGFVATSKGMAKNRPA